MSSSQLHLRKEVTDRSKTRSLGDTQASTETGSPFANGGMHRDTKRFLLLSTSLLVDRVLLRTKLVDTLKELGDVKIWASSADRQDDLSLWSDLGVPVEAFPPVNPFKEFPYNYLRRLNEFVWDYRLRPPSRLSIAQHVRRRRLQLRLKALKPLAYLLAAMRLENSLEDKLESLLLSAPVRSVQGLLRLEDYAPSVIVSSGLFQFEQPALFEAAYRLGIPTLAYIPSWDNISTKNRMVYRYDGYIVWSNQIKQELYDFYPTSREVPVYVVGAPQFDVFFQERFYESRGEFCQKQSLDPSLPIIVYALGSPNFLQEHHGAVHFARRVVNGEFGEIQLLVRPHPVHDNAEMRHIFDNFGPRVRLQASPNAGLELTKRSQDSDQIKEWINTFRHASVVINLSSTVTIDAAIFDKPIVNLDFDPQPSKADQQLIKDVNHKWHHFKPIAESGGIWTVNDFDEMAMAVKTYLERPELHQERRRWVAEYVCGYLDGACGERMAHAIQDFAMNYVPSIERL